MQISRRKALVLAAGLAGLVPAVGHAEEAFSGKTITIVVGYAAGGGYDAYARLAADHLGKFLPGKPAVIVENMEGGGGRRSEVFLASAAAKDGTVISIVPNSFASDSAQRLITGDVDARSFGYIGRLAAGTDAEITWNTSATKTFKDALTRETILGADGVGGNSSTVPRVLNALFGTKFKVVEGYKGVADAALAMQRGEVEGIVFALQTIKSLHPEWIEQKAVNFLWIQAPTRYAEYPDVPSLTEFATNDEQRAILGFLCGNAALGRSLTAPPGVPVEIIALYREAFDAMTKDADFKADAAKRKLPIDYASGSDVAATVKGIMETPPASIARLQEILRGS